MRKNHQAYISLIKEGDQLYYAGKYDEAKKKYEQAQNYERIYDNTSHSAKFNEGVIDKITAAYKA